MRTASVDSTIEREHFGGVNRMLFMPGKTRVSLPHQRALTKTFMFTRAAPPPARLEPHVYLRALRSALRMSAAQLAKRSGVAQAHIARLEKGAARCSVATLKRLFDAMFCDL